MTWNSDIKLTRNTGEDIPFPEASDLFIDAGLEPIGEAAQFARTVNGGLVSIGDPAFQKFALSLSCNTHATAALAGLWPGDRFTVEAPMTLRERGSTPSRPAVVGSEVVGSGWVEYRPVLDCLLVGNSLNETEGRASTSWTLNFEEV